MKRKIGIGCRERESDKRKYSHKEAVIHLNTGELFCFLSCCPKTFWSNCLRQVYVSVPCGHCSSARLTQHLKQRVWKDEHGKESHRILFVCKSQPSPPINEATNLIPDFFCLSLNLFQISVRNRLVMFWSSKTPTAIIEDFGPCPRIEVLWSFLIYTLGQSLNLIRKVHTVEGKDWEMYSENKQVQDKQ